MKQNKCKMKFLLLLIFFSSALADLDTNWWKNTVIYELLVQTFKDSDGDGIGDLKGVISKIDYLKELEIRTLYFTPIYKTNFKDMGYDIINYYEIDPMYGTMEDFDNLMKELKARDMKLIMDLVINHSSDEHEWFKKSVKKIYPYTDYYVWENGEQGGEYPPNYWGSIFENSAWTWNEKRKQYYYHMFLKEQPDLNLRNENVKMELTNMIAFWFDKGVAGFRMDAPMNYIEDKYLRDSGMDGQSNLKESFHFMHFLRNFVDEYNQKHGGFERILAPEAHAPPELVVDYYGKKDYPMTHFAFNYQLEYIRYQPKAHDIERVILSSLKTLPFGERFAWVTEDHDQSRTGSRIGKAFTDIFTIITSLLPGILHLYYGQEIGLLNGMARNPQFKDKSVNGFRDPNRLLMQWDDSLNAGFSSNMKPFSPSNTDYVVKNVENQKSQSISHFNMVKSLIQLRKCETALYGEFNSYVYSTYVYIFWRSYYDYSKIIVAINLGHSSTTVDFTRIPSKLNPILTVYTASVNSGYEKGFEINCQHEIEFVIQPQSAIVFTEKITS